MTDPLSAGLLVAVAYLLGIATGLRLYQYVQDRVMRR